MSEASHLNVLVVDIGGTHVKVLATGQAQPREFPSGPALTPKHMVLRSQEAHGGMEV
jgi:polyphosphate glucokinase